MRKIIFITEKGNEDISLIEWMTKLFPECDISLYPCENKADKQHDWGKPCPFRGEKDEGL